MRNPCKNCPEVKIKKGSVPGGTGSSYWCRLLPYPKGYIGSQYAGFENMSKICPKLNNGRKLRKEL
jgi:hypothetical protein